MKREDLLKDMKGLIGTKEPIEFFDKMVDVLNLLFDKIEGLEKNLHDVKVHTSLSIEWEPRIASDILVKQIEVLRQDKDTYFAELSSLKKAYAEDLVTQNYNAFCQFWQDTLGWHPFLDYK